MSSNESSEISAAEAAGGVQVAVGVEWRAHFHAANHGEGDRFDLCIDVSCKEETETFSSSGSSSNGSRWGGDISDVEFEDQVDATDDRMAEQEGYENACVGHLASVSKRFLLDMHRTLVNQYKLNKTHGLKQRFEENSHLSPDVEYWKDGKRITVPELHCMIRERQKPVAEFTDVLSPLSPPSRATFSPEHQIEHGIDPLTNIEV
jgi:hypothetical protein